MNINSKKMIKQALVQLYASQAAVLLISSLPFSLLGKKLRRQVLCSSRKEICFLKILSGAPY